MRKEDLKMGIQWYPTLPSVCASGGGRGHINMKNAKHNLLSSDDVLILIRPLLTAG